jgi:hypothetical protein
MILGGEKVQDIIDNSNFGLDDFAPYIPPTLKEITDSDTKVTFLGYFEKWDPQECYYYAVDNTGFMPSYERSIGTYSRYTEIDDKIVPFHFYMTFIKFGIGRATYDSAQEVRNEKITRDEALNLVAKFDGEFPEKYLAEFCEYINISPDDFYKIVDSFRSPHLWVSSNGKWKLRHTSSNSGADD